MKRFYFVISFTLLSFKSILAFDFSAEDANGNAIYYSLIGGDSVMVTYETTSYASYSGDIIIPSTVAHNGTIYRVTTIGSNAFKQSTLTSLEIPSSVCVLQSNAFSETNNITELTFHHLKKIDWNAFTGLLHLKKLHIYSVEDKKVGATAFKDCCDLEDIILPDDIEEFDFRSFYSCLLLKEIHLPSSLTSIPINCFEACWNLRHISIPKGVTSIGSAAFLGCIWLKSIVIPKSVQTIGDNFICGTAYGRFDYSYMAHYGGYTIDGGLYPGDASANQLKSIYFESMTPPTVTKKTFSSIIKNNVTCYVPFDALNNYLSDSIYANAFAAIVGINMGESEVINIEETTAKILWESSPIVELYQINVFKADTLIAQIQVDANEQIISQQYFAPKMRFADNTPIHNMPQDTTISGTDYYVISLTGLSAGTQYTYTIQGFAMIPDVTPGAAPGAMVQEKVYYGSGSFQTKLLTALPEIWVDIQSRKGRCVYLIDGRIVILRDGMMYDLMGRRL